MAENKNPVPKNFQKNTDMITAKSKSKKPKEEMDVIGQLNSGAIGVEKKKIVPKSEKVVVEKEKVEEVAIHSSKNVYWPGVGKVLRGYNIVKRDAADKWLTRNHIREATPEEIVREYGL